MSKGQIEVLWALRRGPDSSSQCQYGSRRVLHEAKSSRREKDAVRQAACARSRFPRERLVDQEVIRRRRQKTLEREGIWLAPIYPVGRAGLVEDNRHAIVKSARIAIDCLQHPRSYR